MKKHLFTRFAYVLVFLFTVLILVSLHAFRLQAIKDSRQRAYMVAELVRDTLTSYMVMGVMDRRGDFLSRIKEIPGVEEIRVIRGNSVIRQFGSGGALEVPRDEIERAVLEQEKPIEVLKESFDKVSYKIVIPYKAEPIKGINCLQCHKAEPGEVLGAITLSMDLTYIRAESAKLFFWLAISFILGLGVLVFYFNSVLTKLVKFIKSVEASMSLAKEGNFKSEIKEDIGYETRSLKEAIEETFSSLDKTLATIEDRVMAMMGYGVIKTGNALSDTSRIVEELLNIYRFKKTIEKDKTMEEVYKRILQILEDYMSLENFSFYDVERRKNRMKAIYLRGAESWCNSVIFERADECRAYRTGLDVDSREFPCICPNFIDLSACKEKKLYHYCIPVYVGGKVQYVMQLVYEPEIEPFVSLIIPYIKGYLEEATPILEAKAYMDALKEQSLRDQLTGLYNRRFLDETIDKIVAQIKRRGTNLGILMVDVDYFKQVNDNYGHDTGDKVLKEVANVISKSVREADIVIRFGGEEFMVLLMDIEKGKSEEVAEKIRKAVENHPIEAFGTVLKKTVSIGVSEFPVDSDKIWQCVKFADVALYKAKELDRNQVVRFKPEFWQKEEY
ncbi:MAG: GGDEF domain-containing protein [Aquificaceae bacterium]